MKTMFTLVFCIFILFAITIGAWLFFECDSIIQATITLVLFTIACLSMSSLLTALERLENIVESDHTHEKNQ